MEHTTSIKSDGSYIYFAKWKNGKKAKINPQRSDEKYFQYALTVAINDGSIRKNPQRIKRIRPFIDKYEWKHINFPAEPKD